MSRIWSMMGIGRRSMMNSQTALQTVSNNIANKSTKGYSRQRVDLQTNEPTGSGRLRIGNGARVTNVTRINNPYLEKQIQKESVEMGKSETGAQAMGRVEEVFNEQNNKGLNKYMSEFFNAFRSLSNSPESLAARTLVKESSQFLAKDFKRVNSQLKGIQGDMDFQIATHVTQINDITREIAGLNEKIQVVELNGITANDERDRRDELLKQLGGLINIKYAEGKEGGVTITAGSTAVLVSGLSSRELFVAATKGKPGKSEGNVEIFYKPTKEGTPVNITQQIKGGKLGGLLVTRDKTINDILDNVDEMAYTLAKQVNNIHAHGVDRYNRKGKKIFEVGSEQGAAGRIKVNQDIMDDVSKIAAGAKINAPGDNRIANLIGELQYRNVMGGGENTMDQYYSSIVGKVGVNAGRATSELASQKDLVSQLKNIRESISGVSLDEETSKLIEFQKGFDASARLIKASDEMMDTVLNLKRL